MNIEELLNYKGVDVAPEDFESFWQEEKKNVLKLDPKVVLKKREDLSFKGFQCYDLWFEGIHGAKIYAKCVRPTFMEEKRLPVVLLFHGYGGNSGSFYDKLAFASQGFVVVSMDARGQYGKSNDPTIYNGMTQSGFVARGLIDYNPRKLYFHHLYTDTIQLIQALGKLDFVDINQICAFGGSMGGALATVTAALNAEYVKKVFIGQPFLCDLRRIGIDSQIPVVYSDVKDFIRVYAQSEQDREKLWNTLSYIDIKNFGKYIKAKVKFYVGLSDVTCYPMTQFSLYNNIVAEKDLKTYQNYGHEDLPGAVDEAIMFFGE